MSIRTTINSKRFKKIVDFLSKFQILFSVIILIISHLYIATRHYDASLEAIGLFIFGFFLSIPSFLIGILVTRPMARKAGLGFGFAYITILMVEFLKIISRLWNPFYKLELDLLLVPITFSWGILSTWSGALVGDVIRHIINKKNLVIQTKYAFLFIYVYSLLIFIWVYFL